MNVGRHKTATGQDRELWPLLSFLLLAVVVPTACLLWFMTEAANNERMAVRQKLTELYQAELANIQSSLKNYWKDKAIALNRYAGLPPAEQFAALATNGIAESAIVFDASGKTEYPTPVTPETIAQRSTNDELAATTLQGEVHSCIIAGNALKAVHLVEEKQADENLQNAMDDNGRLIMPYVQLYVLETITDRTNSSYRRIHDELIKRIADYRRSFSSAQRLFLMKRLTRLDPTLSFPTLRAEELAVTYLDVAVQLPRSSLLTNGSSNKLWQIAATNGAVVGLFSLSRAAAEMQSLIDQSALVIGAGISVESAGSRESKEFFLSMNAGEDLPGWILRLRLKEPNPFTAAAEKRVAAYLWTALLVILVIAIVAALVARHLVRQIRLNRLKNDFVATVSHELKTPLASMRVLVDTLLDGAARATSSRQRNISVDLQGKRAAQPADRQLPHLFPNGAQQARVPLRGGETGWQIVRAASPAVRERFETDGVTAGSRELPGPAGDRRRQGCA